jgi:hypothetical protein
MEPGRLEDELAHLVLLAVLAGRQVGPAQQRVAAQAEQVGLRLAARAQSHMHRDREMERDMHTQRHTHTDANTEMESKTDT